jgi:HlyD family secretion protein
MKKIFRFLLVIVLIGLFGYTMYYLYAKSASKPVVFETTEPIYTDIIKKTVATGAVKPRREIEIKPQVSGLVEKLFVQPGDKVKKGDLIARIRIIPNMVALNNAENRVNQSKINLNNAQIDFERNEYLYKEKVIAYAEFQQFKLALETARQEVKAAEENLQITREGVLSNSSEASLTLVKSTANGMVLEVPVEEGYSVIEVNNFNPGTTIAVVADMGKMIFEGKVDESEVGKISEGMELILTIGALDQVKFKAVLEFIAPKGVNENGAIQFTIKAAVEQHAGKFIRAGYSANADIVLQRVENVLALPEAHVRFDEKQKPFVEVESAPQQFEKRSITTGLSDGVNIEIKAGLKAGEKLKK